ncbi:MAG: cyanophycin synthetase [Patescibacteria group bacterium]
MQDSWKSKNVFFLGIKGVMMSNLAIMCLQTGKSVSGSDTDDPQITDKVLSKWHISPISLDDPIPKDTDLVVYGAAHKGKESKQVKDAISKNIKIITQGQFIADLLKYFKNSIAICGSHGKTSTSSMMAYTMQSLGLKVSWLVGAPYFRGYDSKGNVEEFLGGNYVEGSEFLVFEADEYGVCPPTDDTPKILLYHPTHIINTNIDFDHPDIYRDLNHVKNVFKEFYTHSKNVYECNSKSIEENKNGIYKCLHDFGFDINWTKETLKGFVGVARRLEFYGEINQVCIFDDYGHHPAEIIATLKKLKSIYPKRRIVMAFQSHTYSRTIALKDQFIEAFSHADVTLIDAIFPSARENISGAVISSVDLAKTAKAMGYNNIFGFQSRSDLEYFLYSIVKKGRCNFDNWCRRYLQANTRHY